MKRRNDDCFEGERLSISSKADKDKVNGGDFRVGLWGLLELVAESNDNPVSSDQSIRMVEGGNPCKKERMW
jgi:hypothetical protein